MNGTNYEAPYGAVLSFILLFSSPLFLNTEFTDLHNISVKLSISYVTVCCKTDILLSGKNSSVMLQFPVLQDTDKLITLSSLITGDTLAFNLTIYTALIDTTFLKHLSSTTMRRSSFPLTPPSIHMNACDHHAFTLKVVFYVGES
jgi:hypothetical protein